MRAAAEAVVEALFVVDREAGRLLVMERAAGLPLAPRLGARRAPDHARKRDPRAQFIQPLRGDRVILPETGSCVSAGLDVERGISAAPSPARLPCSCRAALPWRAFSSP
jgi:hypothetical protein